MERAMYFLDQKDMPTHWYNVLPDLPEPLPPLVHPGTKGTPSQGRAFTPSPFL